MLTTYFYRKYTDMNKWLFAIVIFSLISCKHKKVDLAGDEPVKVNDFIAAFDIQKHPFFIADTNMLASEDSTIISYKVASKFMPDSVFDNIYGEDRKHLIIHPLGRLVKATEIYLLMNIHNGKSVQFAVAAMDKKNKFLAFKVMFDMNNNEGYIYSTAINNEPSFVVTREKLNKDKLDIYTKIGWAYLSGNEFTEILNDGNEDEKNMAIINPIDTLPMKNAWSGNYITDKKNFISVRDGKTTGLYHFFVHFEKKEGTCTGELKGEFKVLDAKHAIYSVSGDPCLIDFTLNENELTMKEKGKCGNRRGMNCLFDDTFVKQKVKKTKIKK